MTFAALFGGLTCTNSKHILSSHHIRLDVTGMSKQKSDKDKSSKKNTSLRLDSKTLKALKIRAIEEDSSVQAIIESLVLLYLKQEITLPKDKKNDAAK